MPNEPTACLLPDLALLPVFFPTYSPACLRPYPPVCLPACLTYRLSPGGPNRPACRPCLPPLPATPALAAFSSRGALLQRRELLLLWDELELVHKVHVVLEAGIQVGLCAEGRHALEVAVIDVRVDAEEPAEDVAYVVEKVGRKRHANLRKSAKVQERQVQGERGGWCGCDGKLEGGRGWA
eukprot:6212713-Pleurochrysis_carterae.AAC.3